MKRKISIIIVIILFGVLIINGVSVGYAISLDTSGIPNGNFTTNVTSSNPATMNLVGDALGSSSSYTQAEKDSFKVVENIRDSDGTYPLYLFSKNSMVPRNSETFEYGSAYGNPTVISDAGLKYIIRNGYNGSKIGTKSANNIFDRDDLKTEYGVVSNNNEKQYITQIAIWKYLYQKSSTFNQYCSNSRCAFNGVADLNRLNTILTAAAASNKKLNYINKLVDEANNPPAANDNTFTISNKINNYEFKNNRAYIVTGLISLTNVDTRFVNWSATVIDPNNYGITILDENENELSNTSNLSADAKIRLKVPLRSDLTTMNLTTAGVKLQFNVLTEDVLARDFRVSTTTDNTIVVGAGGTKVENFSNVLMGAVTSSSSERSYNLRNFTDIRKTDLGSGDEIGGAGLAIYSASDIDSQSNLPKSGTTVLKDGNNNDLAWVSEAGKSKKLFLDDGNYALCETVAPDGYESKTECIPFTVANNTAITVVTMTNSLIPIPDTGTFKSFLPYIFGFSAFIIGCGTVFYLTKVKKKEKNVIA